jgi:hypothetical protein
MNANASDINTTEQTKKPRKRHKLFTPRPADFPPRELDDLDLHLLKQTALNGVMHTHWYFMLDGAETPNEQDRYRRRLERLFHNGLMIRLRPNTRENAPMLYRGSPKGGRVLHAAGIWTICHEHEISQSQHYQWRDQFLAHAANACEAYQHTRTEARLAQENARLKTLVGELTLELKKSDARWG